MIRCAIINTTTNDVENVIEYDAQPSNPPPGFGESYICVTDPNAGPGWTWNGTVCVAPSAPAAPALPQSVMSQDIMAQFTAADATLIQAAVNGNAQFWLLWSAMQAQSDPMIVTNARFITGWTALVQVLGAARMAAIATALNITVA